MLLRGADTTLISTMDHLVVANIVDGRKKKALQVSIWYSANVRRPYVV